MNRKFTVDLDGRTYDVILEQNRYIENNNLYLGLFCPTEGPFASLTVNIDRLPAGMAAVDTNNNPWAEEFITGNGLGERTGRVLKSGFCIYPVYEFNMELIDELAPMPY